MCNCTEKAGFADLPDWRFNYSLDSCIRRAHATHAEYFNLIYGFEALNWKYRARTDSRLLADIRNSCAILQFRLGLTVQEQPAKRDTAAK